MTDSELPIFPSPTSCKRLNGAVDLTRGVRWLPAANLPLEAVWLDGLSTQGSLDLQAEIDSCLQPEAYHFRLEPDGIHLRARDRRGLFYGLTALKQILATEEKNFPALEILDEPALKIRGIMLDISRTKIPTLESLQDRIKRLASLRYNQLQLYTEHTFAFSQHKKVWKDASPLTSEDYQILQDFCHQWCLELVPNLNSFGHMERWICHPEYHPLAEHPASFKNHWGTTYPNGTTLKPNDDSAEFMESLYEEFLPCFQSRYFHMGGDETWDLGKGWSQKQVEAEGLGPVYCRHLRRLAQRVEKFGKIPQFWADIIINHPDSLREIPRPSVPVLWGYEADHPFPEEAEKIKKTGLPFMIAPGTSSWLSLGTRGKNARVNIQRAVQCAREFGAEGTLLTDWGDRGHHQFWVSSWVPVFQMAGAAWTGTLPENTSIRRVLSPMLGWSSETDWAEMLFQIATLDQHFSQQPHNNSPLYQLLIASPEDLQDLQKKITIAEMKSAEEQIQEIQSQVPGDNRDPQPQIFLTLKLLEIAVQRGLGTARSEDLRNLLPTYSEIRLRESRPGGLDESMHYLRQVATWIEET